MKNSYEGEDGYIDLLKDTLEYGEETKGRNGNVLSRFGIMITFENIQESFPLLTTKKMFTKGIIHELLWFIRGSTNANELKEKGVNIWEKNTTREFLDSVGLYDYPEGEIGAGYGHQWRSFNGDYPKTKNSNKGFDQLKYVIQELQNNSRRAILSAWNPCQLDKMALPPCHILYNFYKDKNGLSCMLNMRSNDVFLGQPFNIASAALFTMIIAKVLHLPAYKICISICDLHIYEEHIDAVKTQIERPPYKLPKMTIESNPPELTSSIEEKIKWIESLKYDDFKLNDYFSHNAIKAPMK
jgi:thymidylate synthase